MGKKQELIVHLFVFDLVEQKQIRKHRVNLRNPKQLEWMRTVMVWATQNHCSIELVNTVDLV